MVAATVAVTKAFSDVFDTYVNDVSSIASVQSSDHRRTVRVASIIQLESVLKFDRGPVMCS